MPEQDSNRISPVPKLVIEFGPLALFFVTHASLYRSRMVDNAERIPAARFAIAYGALFALALPWISSEYMPFIYFQF